MKRVAVTCNQARVVVGMGSGVPSPCPCPGPGPSSCATVCRAVIRVWMAEDDPREGHGSLMMLRGTICVVRLRDHVMTRGWRMRGARMMVTTGRRVVICIIGAAVVIVIVLLLPLTIFFIFHPSILKPYLHLSLGQIQISRELPPFLLRHVSVE